MKNLISVLIVYGSVTLYSQPCGGVPSINFGQNTVDVCYGSGGSNHATIVGGVGDIYYNWFPFSSDNNILEADSIYIDTWVYLEITDDCFTVIDSFKFDVSEITPSSINVANAADCSGLGGATGSIQVLPDHPDWTYSLHGGGADFGPILTSTFSNLQGGIIYWLKIENTEGCVLDTAINVPVNSNPTSFNFSSSDLQHLVCYSDSNGFAEITNVSGGVLPPYNIYWSNTNGLLSQSVVTAGDDASISNLSQGDWVVSAVDQNGCAHSQFFTIQSPDDIKIAFSTNNPTCYGFADGSLSVNIVGGNGGNSISIMNELGSIVNIGGVPGINFLIEGWYYCEVTDNQGCTGFDSVFIDGPNQFQATFTYINPWCAEDGDGSIFVSNVQNFHGNFFDVQFFWSPDPLGINGVGADTMINVNGGHYDLLIQDSWGCSELFDVLLWPDSLKFVSLTATTSTNGTDGTLSCVVSGGATPYSYEWKTIGGTVISTNQTVSNVSPGIYIITVTHSGTCSISDTVVVEMLSADHELLSDIELMNVNNKLIVKFDNLTEKHTLIIYDNLGNVVFISDLTESINSFDISEMSAGIYYYKVDSAINKTVISGKLFID